jgi:hypothetical protein
MYFIYLDHLSKTHNMEDNGLPKQAAKPAVWAFLLTAVLCVLAGFLVPPQEDRFLFRNLFLQG